MNGNALNCVHEDDVESFRITREGTTGYVLVSRLIDPEASRSEQAIIIIAEVPAHQAEGIPPHFHREYEETMYVAKGRGVFRIGDSPDAMQAIPIRPGSCCYVPAECYHSVAVEGDEALKLVCAYFCSSGEGGKSHRQISVELTSLPLQGAYGQTQKD
jgi:mannose-6-phosphate isomerase-like protein (cupin superfamily)